jgi:CheY-like chemotaxis protein
MNSMIALEFDTSKNSSKNYESNHISSNDSPTIRIKPQLEDNMNSFSPEQTATLQLTPAQLLDNINEEYEYHRQLSFDYITYEELNTRDVATQVSFEPIKIRTLDDISHKISDIQTTGSFYNKKIYPDIILPPLRILVVDDSELNRKMMLRLLKNRCTSCIEAEDGQDAVDQMKLSLDNVTSHIDMVIMDCNMPRMDGMEASRAMRNMGYRGKILGVTGNVDPKDTANFKSHGADVVFSKPFNVKKFDKYVRKKVIHK